MIASLLRRQPGSHWRLVAALCLFLGTAALAQKTPPVTGDTLEGMSELNFEQLTMKQGLPHESVYAVAQDKTGYIWIATFGGLARYSGYHVRAYIHAEDDLTSLPDNNVRTLVTRDDGGLWIGTGSTGMTIYNPETDSFSSPANTPPLMRKAHVFCMAPDGEGGVWYGSQYGLTHYTHDGRFELYGAAAGKDNAPGFPARGSIFSVFIDQQKNLWVGSEAGLYLREAGAKQFVLVPGLEGPGEIGARPPVWTIFQDHAGTLWIGTDITGLGTVDDATLRVRGVPGLAGQNSQIGAHTVRGFIEIAPGDLWMATYGGGLFRIETAHGLTVRHWVKDATASQPLSNDFVRCIFEDRSGEVWLGTDNGLSRFNANARGIFNIHSSPLRTNGLFGSEVRSVAAGYGRVAVGFDQGGFAIIEGDGAVHRVRPAAGMPARNLSDREVLAIKAADERTFFAGGAGLYSIDVPSMTYRKVDSPDLDRQIINALMVDGSKVWAGTYNGLRLYDRATGKVRVFDHQIGDPASLSDNYVRDLLKTSDGRIWVTTRLGLDLYDPNTGGFQHIRHSNSDPGSLANDNIQPLAEDMQGRLWIGTIGSGVAILDGWPQGGQPRFRMLDHRNGLPSDIVLMVIRGLDGTMWINTMGGLARVDPRTYKVEAYSEADGLPNSTQNLFSSAVLPDGTLLFPGSSSLVFVRPDGVHPWTYEAPLVLTTVSIPGNGGSPVVLAQRAMDGTLQFPSHQGFHATFALLDFTYPSNTQYEYRLENFDSSWSEPSEQQNGATYTNLPPGNYRFQVRAVSRDGQGPATMISVPIVVTARFYETGLFRALCVLAVVAGVIVFIRIRVAFMSRQQSVLENEIALRTAELKEKQRELMLANERLAELALHDTLTGLLNRRGFYERAEMEIIRSQRSSKPFSLLLVDLDNFKSINDTMGHVAGDECLRRVAEALTLNLRPTDVVARYGGEEMILLLPETDEDVAKKLAERLRQAVADLRVMHNGQTISLTISVGLSSSYQSKDLDQLIAVVDKALYAAKHDGKNCVRYAY